MHPIIESKSIMYNYVRDGKTCTTPNVEIAVSRRDTDTDIEVETTVGDKTEYSKLTIH